MSYVNYQTDKQTLLTGPGSYSGNVFGAYDHLQQNLKLKTMEVNHSASVGFSYKKWTFTPEVGLNMNFNKMNSLLSGINNSNPIGLGNSFENDIQWNEIQPYTQIGLNFKSSNLNLNVNLPMNFYGIDYQDHIRNVSREISKTVFEPSMF
jgi:hypothetical protein